jgi:DNA-binding CsgD family transcriptional regulator
MELQGRQGQLETLRDQVDAVLGGCGGIVLVTGDAGMGKTVLLDAAEEMAHEHGIAVFRGAGDVAGQVIPFGPLLEALVSSPDAPVDPAVLRDLSQSPDLRFWMLREVQESLERFALRTPMLIAIDDLHWADPATLIALGTTPLQLATHRILWLLTARPGELTAAARRTLSRLAGAGARTVTLTSLDDAAVAAVASDVLGGTPDLELQQVLAGVQGQPFLLTELLHGLRDEKQVSVNGGLARLTGTRIPLQFVDSVNYQLGRLTPQTRDVLQMACVLGRRFSADELAGLTATTPATIFGALREAAAAGLVAEDGDRMAFRHDLVREVVDAALPSTIRQSLRRQAVEVMLRHGAPPADVAELVVKVAEPGDTTAITILRKAAAETGRVCSTVASQLSRRALELTPPSDPGRGTLTTETLTYLMCAGRAADAVNLVTAAAGDLSDPAAEAEVRLNLAHLAMQYAPGDVVEHCQRALALPDVPAALRVQLLSVVSAGFDLIGDPDGADKSAVEAAEVARASGDPGNEVFTLVPRAARAAARGEWRQALDLAGQAAARKNTGSGSRLSMPDSWQALIHVAVARLDEAFALIDAGMRDAQRDGIGANIRVWSMLRFRALYCAGRLADTRAEAEATIEMADEIGDGSYGYFTHVARYVLGRVALHTGDPAGLSEARRTAASLGRAGESLPSQRLGVWLMALAAEADGRAALDARSGPEVLDLLAHGPLSVTSPQMYSDIAAATRILLRAGRRSDARAAVIRLEDFAMQHPDYPFLTCAAVHARAVLDDDPDAALRAVELSATDPRQLVRAAVLEDAGRLLPVTRADEAVSLLGSALASYTRAGAERDAARVRSLLRTRGVRPPVTGPRSAPGWPELTESEFTVVSLVARGATNREIAERLYLSPFTVNSHLRHVFTKLGIRSRVELARLAAERQRQQRSQSG